MPTSLYVLTPGDLIYVKPDGTNMIRTYQITPTGTVNEVTGNNEATTKTASFSALDVDLPPVPAPKSTGRH